MLHGYKDTKGLAMGATDGNIGHVHDLLFDDHTWTIRYIVVDTGKWLPGRRVLISPVVAQKCDWSAGLLYLDLTRKQIEESPPVETDKPVSRRREEELHAYFGWPAYWSPAVPGMGAAAYAGIPSDRERFMNAEDAAIESRQDPNLRSVREVIGYTIQTQDGKMGHIEDFLVDDHVWIVRYVVIDTVNWWPSRKVVLSPSWISGMSWDTRRVRFDLTKKEIEHAPDYDPALPVDRGYESKLHEYYKRQRYWESQKPDQAEMIR